MDSTAQLGKLHRLFDENFIEYTSYVIRERAIPDVDDGLKPVQRRLLQTLTNMDDGRFQKVANVVGDTMKLHPHGDASIFAALVNLANKEYLIERQGNFGNIYTGDQASAARYIECRLTPLARETLFNKDLTTFLDSYDGRMKEAVTLPVKIPLLLMLGAEGIAVGMATKIMPHNFPELLEAQKKILRHEEFEIFPDFRTGGLLDVSGYDRGNGRLKSRARISEKNDKTIVITEIPYGTTTQSISDSIERADRAGRIKIQSIDDYTAEQVEIEIKLARGMHARDTIKALYAFTDCEVSISPNLIAIRDRTPVNLAVEEVLRHNTEKLVRDLERELNIEHGRLQEKLHARLLEQIFIEERIYKRIEECKSFELVVGAVADGLQPFSAELVREVSREDIERLLEIRIKRISRHDINQHRKEIQAIKAAIREVNKSLKDMVGFTIRYLDRLLEKYGPLYPRRTEIATFQEVEARKVALSHLTIGYDRESGLLGHQVKPDDEFAIPCSEYDKILLIFKDGRYKVLNVPDKIFVGHDLLWADKVADETVFNLIYRDGEENQSYVKRFKTPKFILGKEYRFFPEHPKSVVQFLRTGEGVRLRVDLMPSPRAKSNSQRLHLDDYLIKHYGAIGKRLSHRAVRRITELVGKAAEGDDNETRSPTPEPGPGPGPAKTAKPPRTSGQEPGAGAGPENEAGRTEPAEPREEGNTSARNRGQLALFDLPKKNE